MAVSLFFRGGVQWEGGNVKETSELEMYGSCFLFPMGANRQEVGTSK